MHNLRRLKGWYGVFAGLEEQHVPQLAFFIGRQPAPWSHWCNHENHMSARGVMAVRRLGLGGAQYWDNPVLSRA